MTHLSTHSTVNTQYHENRIRNLRYYEHCCKTQGLYHNFIGDTAGAAISQVRQPGQTMQIHQALCIWSEYDQKETQKEKINAENLNYPLKSCVLYNKCFDGVWVASSVIIIFAN